MDWAWTPQSYRIKAKNNYHHRRHNSSQLPAAPAPGCPEILQGQASVVGQMLSMNGNGDESKPPASVAKPHKIYTPTTGWDLGNVPPTPPAFVLASSPAPAPAHPTQFWYLLTPVTGHIKIV